MSEPSEVLFQANVNARNVQGDWEFNMEIFFKLFGDLHWKQILNRTAHKEVKQWREGEGATVSHLQVSGSTLPFTTLSEGRNLSW